MRAALALIACLAATPAMAFECHTALVLGLDASRSVDARESELQRRGLADALRDPDVAAAIAPHADHGVAALAFEWSDPDDQVVVAPWSVLDGAAAIEAFAAAIEAGPRVERRWKTGLGAAMRFAAEAHRAAPVACRRRIVDISGDGPGNAGPPPFIHRASGAFKGLIINGLVIRNPEFDSAQPPGNDPLPYYQTEVAQGPGAFVIETRSYEDYPAAIRRKLLRELAAPLAAR